MLIFLVLSASFCTSRVQTLKITCYDFEEKGPLTISIFQQIRRYVKPKAPLYILANHVDWQLFEDEFEPLYCPDNGPPAKPIRLMVGLLYFIRDLFEILFPELHIIPLC